MKLTKAERAEARRMARVAQDRRHRLGRREDARAVLLTNLIGVPGTSDYLLPNGLTTMYSDLAVEAWAGLRTRRDP